MKHGESIEQDMERLLRVTGCKLQQITTKSRSEKDFRRRHLFAAVLHRMGYSHTQIGGVINRDHSTVTHMMGMRYHNPREIERVWEAFERDMSADMEGRGEERGETEEYMEEEYLKRVEECIGCSVEELRSEDRSRALCDKRRLFAALMKQGGYSISKISKLMNRDSRSVAHLLDTVYVVERELEEVVRRMDGENRKSLRAAQPAGTDVIRNEYIKKAVLSQCVRRCPASPC